MTIAVIDTNVLLVANNKHPDISPVCVLECVQRLEQIKKQGIVVIDDGWRLVGEYKHKTQPNQPKGPGDVFLKWLLQNISNPQRIHQVPVTESSIDNFTEFPDSELQQQLDPPVWQATDCKWLDWWPQLKTHGVNIEFLCPDDVCQFYQAKFPEKTPPSLPD